MDGLTSSQIVDARLDDWRKLARALHARFHTGDFVTGLKFVTAVTEAAERANQHPDVTLTYPFVHVKLISHDVSQLTQRDIDLARRISEIAREQGIGAEPSAPAEIELALDTAVATMKRLEALIAAGCEDDAIAAVEHRRLLDTVEGALDYMNGLSDRSLSGEIAAKTAIVHDKRVDVPVT